MATIVKTPSGTWKAVIRKIGWPTTAKTFRTKRDAEDWGRRTEDEMVRGVYLSRAPSEKLTVSAALKRYMEEVSVTKKATTQRSESFSAKHLEAFFGKYSMAAVSAELAAKYRDERLAAGKSNNTVRLEPASLRRLLLSICRLRSGPDLITESYMNSLLPTPTVSVIQTIRRHFVNLLVCTTGRPMAGNSRSV